MDLIRAKNKYIRISPYKLRPIIDVIRGYPVGKALAWLNSCALKRVRPVIKTILCAYANGKNLHSDISSMDELMVKDIWINQGPTIKYFKPGAMGRANIQRKRLSHLEVRLERISNRNVHHSGGDEKNVEKKRG